MSARVVISPAARSDMADLANFISLTSAEAAVRFLENAVATMEWLASMPRAGSIVPTRLPRLAGLRKWPVAEFPNHLIVYRPVEQGVNVLRVFHSASNWRDRLRRESKRR